MLELVEVVERQLDELYGPDGHNVGFSAGEPAGQTVMHLHVQVIPRTQAAGAARHPSKGNI